MTQSDLARKAGFSLASIKAYETGARRPSVGALESIIGALGIPRGEANQILTGAGYAPDPGSVLHAGFEPPSQAELESEAEMCPWPAFATKQNFDLLFANRVFQRIIEVELDGEYWGFGDRNFLSRMTDENFARRLQNWDEVVMFLAGLPKGDPRWQSHAVGRPAPWLEVPLHRSSEGNPDRIRRFAELWESAPAIPRRLRHRYRVRWLYKGEVPMSFLCTVVVVNIGDEIHWHEWIPADNQTWHVLEGITKES